MRRKNVSRHNERKTISLSKAVVWFCLCSFTVIFLTSDLAFAETKKNNPDPTDFLESHLNTSKSNNEQPKDITAAPKSIAIKIQAKPASPVNFAAKDSTVSNKLTSARITPPVSERTSENKSELRNLINQLNSVEIKKSSSFDIDTENKQPVPSEKIVPESIESISLQNYFNEVSKKESYESPAMDSNNLTETDFDTTKQQGNLKAETIKLIKDLINSPESFNSFFELGEIMFYSNRLSDAYVFYKRALDSADKDNEENRAWITFQLANCLRNTDYSKAIEYYKMLIAEFPQCEWSEFAKDQVKLLGWYLNDDPQGLIKKSRTLVE